MRRIRHAMFGAAATTALLLTAACEHEDDPVPPPPSSSPGEEQIIGPSPTPNERDSSGAGAGDITAPGTELSFSDRAVVPHRDGVIAITVTAFEEADQASFQSAYETDELLGYEIWFTMENVSDEDLSFASAPILDGVQADGSRTGAILIGRSLDDCEQEGFPADSGTGASVDTCVITASPPGIEIAGIEFAQTDGGYDDDPIIWWL